MKNALESRKSAGEKAYKVLAAAKKISHKKAKELIDKGLVSVSGKRLSSAARAQIPWDSKFEIIATEAPKIIFEDENILAVDKPPFVESYDLAERFKGWVLLHRLDRETSGVILLVRPDSAFAARAKAAFKHREVYKEYRAWVWGVVAEGGEVNLPLKITKGRFGRASIAKKSDKDALNAHTAYAPLELFGKKTLLSVVIKTGRLHQIRAHLKAIGHPILGDLIYGQKPAENKKSQSKRNLAESANSFETAKSANFLASNNSFRHEPTKRLLLHAHKISLLGYTFTSPMPKDFTLR